MILSALIRAYVVFPNPSCRPVYLLNFVVPWSIIASAAWNILVPFVVAFLCCSVKLGNLLVPRKLVKRTLSTTSCEVDGALRYIIKSLEHQLLLTTLTSLKWWLNPSLLPSHPHRWCLIYIPVMTLARPLNIKIRTRFFSSFIFNNDTTGRIINLFRTKISWYWWQHAWGRCVHRYNIALIVVSRSCFR